VRAADPFEVRTQSFDGGARSRVASVSLQRDALGFPRFERMAQHEQFGFGVDRGALRRRGQPRATDLRGLRSAPRANGRSPDSATADPVVEVEVAGAPDDATAVGQGRGEGQRPPRLLVSKDVSDVPAHRLGAVGHRREAVRRAVLARGGDEVVDVIEGQGLQRHDATREHDPFRHGAMMLARDG
jgi:hypothetical protein